MGKGILAAWLCAALLFSAGADAQAHGPSATDLKDEIEDLSDPSVHAAKLAELETWLRRLVGKYRVTSMVNGMPPHEGLIDCIAVGAGPGVQCMWGGNRAYDDDGVPEESALLFGLDPGALKINFLWVDRKGIANGSLARLAGNTLYSRLGCKIPNNASNVISCEIKLRFIAKSDMKDVDISRETIMRVRTASTPQAHGDIVEQTSVTTSWLKRAPDLEARPRK